MEKKSLDSEQNTLYEISSSKYGIINRYLDDLLKSIDIEFNQVLQDLSMLQNLRYKG